MLLTSWLKSLHKDVSAHFSIRTLPSPGGGGRRWEEERGHRDVSWDHLGNVQSKRPTLGAHSVSHTSTPSAANCLSPKYSPIMSMNIDSAGVILTVFPSRVAIKHGSGLNAAQDGCLKNGRRSINYRTKLRKRPVDKRGRGGMCSSV